MTEPLLAMAKELVTELIRAKQLSSDDYLSVLQSTHNTLQQLEQRETGGAAAPAAVSLAASGKNWRQSIHRRSIECLECGATFRQLSSRHLRLHNLTPEAYRSKYGIPSTQPLSSREATARRRELASQIRPWEQAAAKRTAAKAQVRRKGAKQTAKA